MKITLIQTALAWENPAENRRNFTQLINTIQETDLIILPEMFTTGFTMNPGAISEPMDGETVSWMKQLSTEKNCAITGSLVIEGGNFYNTLLLWNLKGQSTLMINAICSRWQVKTKRTQKESNGL
jgi:omega-amidase